MLNRYWSVVNIIAMGDKHRIIRQDALFRTTSLDKLLMDFREQLLRTLMELHPDFDQHAPACCQLLRPSEAVEIAEEIDPGGWSTYTSLRATL
jgi:hypothetical protein